MRVASDDDAGGKLEVARGEGVRMHRGEVDADVLGDVTHLADDMDVVELVDDDDARALGRIRCTVELEADGDIHDFVKVDAREVHVDDIVAEEPELQVLDQAGLRALALDLEVEHMEAALEGADGDLLVDMHRQRLAAVPVDHRRQTARRTKALRIATAEAVAGGRLNCGNFLSHCVYSDAEKG